MFRKFFWIILIVIGYILFIYNDKDKVLFKKIEKSYIKYYKELRKDMKIEINDFKKK